MRRLSSPMAKPNPPSTAKCWSCTFQRCRGSDQALPASTKAMACSPPSNPCECSRPSPTRYSACARASWSPEKASTEWARRASGPQSGNCRCLGRVPPAPCPAATPNVSVVAAQVDAHRGEVGDVPGQVGSEPVALEVVAEVVAPQQQGERVLEIVHLLQLVVVGAADERGAEGDAPRAHQRLLELEPVEQAV